MDGKNLERAVSEACLSELELRGLRCTSAWSLELELAPGITGVVSIATDLSQGEGQAGSLVTVTPIIGVRHEEASKLASRLLGLAPGQYSQPAFALENLIKDRVAPLGWIARDAADVPLVSYRVAEDVVLYGFPFMEGLRTTESIIRELSLPRWRIHGTYILAVLYMLDGRAAEARHALMHKMLPTGQNPTTWSSGTEQFVTFLEAFQDYFNVDFDVANWPTRPARQKKPIGINFRGPVAPPPTPGS